MPGLIDRYRNWRQQRLERKLTRLAPPHEPVSPPANVRPLTQGELRVLRRFSASGLSWDDVEQRYTMLGPMTPIYSGALAGDDLDALLRASAWSWASINGNAKAMSQLTPIVQERNGGKWSTAPDDHPLYRFIADPLGTDDALPYWSWQHLFYVMSLHYYSVGNSYLVPVETFGGELSVIPLIHPECMTVKPEDLNELEVPTQYTYQVNGTIRTFAPGDLVNVMAPAPSSFWKGSSPLRAALRSTEIDQVASERQRYNLRNRVSPGPVFSFDMPLGPTEDQRLEVKNELLADYTEVQDTGKPLIMGSAGKIDRGFNSEELQVFETKAGAREEIIATIGTQPSVLGQLDNATYSNTKEATVLWFSDSIAPILEIMYGHINAQMVQRRYDASTRIWYSHAGSAIGMQILSSKLDVAEKLQRLGYTTNDIDAHLELGMGHKDYLDKSTGADVIAGRAPAEDTDDEVEPDADAEPAPDDTVEEPEAATA